MLLNYYKKDKIFALPKHTITPKMQNTECVELKSLPAGFPKGYPCYKVLKINGITDIIELRKMEPFFI
jgi:hypothetical protein